MSVKKEYLKNFVQAFLAIHVSLLQYSNNNKRGPCRSKNKNGVTWSDFLSLSFMVTVFAF